MNYKAVIFDMDGTVLNTIDDLCAALNYAMEQTGHDHAYIAKDISQFFGSGVTVAIKRALSVENGASYESLVEIGTPEEKLSAEITMEEVLRIQNVFKPYYNAHCAVKTGEYEGMTKLLNALREKGIRTAVVSNKPDSAVQKLVVDYFDGMFDLSVGEKEGIRRKPFPDMTLSALQKLGLSASEAVYVGDTEIDFQTAKNSGMDCICVTWGFRTREFLKELGAKQIVSDVDEIMKIVLGE